MTGTANHRLAPTADDAYRRLLEALDDYRPPCRGRTDQWFAVRPRPEVFEACRNCRVAELCRTYANAAGEQYGVWGGTDRSVKPTRSRGIDHIVGTDNMVSAPPAPQRIGTDRVLGPSLLMRYPV